MLKILALFLLGMSSAFATDTIVRPTDPYGNIQYHKPGYVITTDGRIIPTDPYGNKLYHKDQYKIQEKKPIEKPKQSK